MKFLHTAATAFAISLVYLLVLAVVLALVGGLVGIAALIWKAVL